MTRQWNDPLYKKWRTDVYKRDSFMCQMPSCGSKGRLNAHHIKRWAGNPFLRFNINNGITLCQKCHKSIHNKEEQYELFFFKLLIGKSRHDK
jgi:5-methylcytosine-specific restriction endonuclease McrA